MNERTHPLVTIGIPTYNRADGFLRQALESALNQTYRNIEIVVSDNCSPDHTGALVTGYGDPRIRYFRHDKNIGPANNFNFCLEQAQGAYFLLLHDDDLIDEDFVQVCLEKANYETHYGVIRTGVRAIDAQGRVKHEAPNLVEGLSTEEFFRGWFSYKTSWYLVSTLFNTQRLKEMGGLHSKCQLLQDGVAIARLAAQYGRVDVPEIKASFRKHPDERTFAVKVGDWCDDFLDLLDLMGQLAPEGAERLRVEGSRFFARLSYSRAQAVKAPLERWKTYWIVFEKFDFKHLPPPVLKVMEKFDLNEKRR
ncbi:MAG: glycosyltransferase family 2 protein [Chloroflexota bacterium]